MAERIEEFDISPLIGSTPNTPSSFLLDFTQGDVESIDVHIPFGHHDITGIQIWYAQRQMIPITPGDWLTGNDRIVSYDMQNYPAGQSWFAFGYNTDIIPHVFKVFINVQELSGPDVVEPLILLPVEPLA